MSKVFNIFRKEREKFLVENRELFVEKPKIIVLKPFFHYILRYTLLHLKIIRRNIDKLQLIFFCFFRGLPLLFKINFWKLPNPDELLNLLELRLVPSLLVCLVLPLTRSVWVCLYYRCLYGAFSLLLLMWRWNFLNDEENFFFWIYILFLEWLNYCDFEKSVYNVQYRIFTK